MKTAEKLVQVYIKESLKRRLKEHCAKRGTTIVWVMDKLVNEYLKASPKKHNE